jgi:sec-independent protein translocase protein TatA
MLADVFGVDGIIVLIVVVVLLFGGAAIPKLARNLGSAKNEFEKGLDDGKKAAHAATHVTPSSPAILVTPVAGEGGTGIPAVPSSPVAEHATPAS